MLDALQQLDHENQYLLYSPKPIDYPISNPNFKCRPTPGMKILGRDLPGILWQQTTLVKALRKNPVDIFWGPEQTIPTLSCHCKKVLTVHDFVHKRYPETMRKSVLWINENIGQRSILKADRIVAVSDFTKQELHHFYPQVPSARTIVVPNGTNIQVQQTVSAQDRQRQLLFVGSLEPRKNLKNLIAALEILKERGVEVPLILTGPKGWKNSAEVDLLKNSPVAGNIRHLGFVSDEELRNLYATSAAVVFPSFYEGFGLPVLEALAAGTPVLTSKNSVMENIAGTCGIYFDPEDPSSIADTIDKFFASTKLGNILKSRETERQEILNSYRWENSAQKLLDVFNDLNQQKQD